MCFSSHLSVVGFTPNYVYVTPPGSRPGPASAFRTSRDSAALSFSVSLSLSFASHLASLISVFVELRALQGGRLVLRAALGGGQGEGQGQGSAGLRLKANG